MYAQKMKLNKLLSERFLIARFIDLLNTEDAWQIRYSSF